MLCAMHSLPVRRCFIASRAAFKASHGHSKPWHEATFCSVGVKSTARAIDNTASTWQKDLADVLREPEATVPCERAEKPLQAWQISKLQAAAAAGRRKVKINDLAHELQISRPEVLKFLKTSTVHTNRSSSAAQALPQQATGPQSMESGTQDMVWDDETETERHQLRAAVQQEASKKASKKKSGPPVPFVERQRQGSDFESKRLGRAVEATLERLYEESQRPSDEMLQSVLQLHKGVPRKKLVDWFGQRRRMDTGNHGRKQQR